MEGRSRLKQIAAVAGGGNRDDVRVSGPQLNETEAAG